MEGHAILRVASQYLLLGEGIKSADFYFGYELTANTGRYPATNLQLSASGWRSKGMRAIENWAVRAGFWLVAVASRVRTGGGPISEPWASAQWSIAEAWKICGPKVGQKWAKFGPKSKTPTCCGRFIKLSA